jgi:hypothetical protein
MIRAIATSVIALLLLTSSSFAQTQTTGRIAGTVKDQKGAVIVGAEVLVTSETTGEARRSNTDADGNYSVSVLQPGSYRVRISAAGFQEASLPVRISITEMTTLDVTLVVPGPDIRDSFTVADIPLIQRDGPQLGRVVDSRAVSDLPLATRNFTQITALSPGATTYLPDSTSVGRSSQFINVNGARATSNNFQINGVDANATVTNSPQLIAVPAPESIQEFKVQTSLYDATVGRSGGGQIQAITKSGGNNLHGNLYEYLRDDALNANNPFLKAANVRRPVLKRNVFGGTLGGPVQKDRSFFFVSYQGTHERNGASLVNGISSEVLIAPGLTDDRSTATLLRVFHPIHWDGQAATSINPTALALLNLKLGNGQFLIPTPQANGRYSGSAISRFREEQFNTNFDYRINEKNWLAIKFFFSNAPQFLALSGSGANVPGFGLDQQTNNRIISLQDIHTFSSTVVNEARVGYNFVRINTFPEQPVKDSDVGINRSTAATAPGLPLINVAGSAGGILIGAPLIDARATSPSTSAVDILSITRGRQSIRTGAEFRYYESNFSTIVFNRGFINFLSFNDFLTGAPLFAVVGNGISERSLRATDYNFFIQDDWKVSSKLTLNLGLRYELNLPPYDTRGRIATFDPTLYKPRPLASNGIPLGPPIDGIVQAGNALPQYDLPDVPNVGKRVLRSVDPNNFAPRVGFAYSPFKSERAVVRGGYGIYYSRSAFEYISSSLLSPPFFLNTTAFFTPIEDPFAFVPAQNQFPTVVTGATLGGFFLDRNIRTPYLQQYNASLQSEVAHDLLLEVAYVGTHGSNLFRSVAINQARLASPDHPIINDVTGEVITTNTPENAFLRAPFQGVELSPTTGFAQGQTTAHSNYNSLQASLSKRFSKGLQFLASYTYAKSIDNASGVGGGSGTSGIIDQSLGGESSSILGNQLDPRANRGVSDFDRTHRFVFSYVWDLPRPKSFDHSKAKRFLLSDWQASGIIVAMSGLPIDIEHTAAGSLYGITGGARPNWLPNANRRTATSNIPAGYFFNPFAFAQPVVEAGQLIPSSNGSAIASAPGTDIGNVGRNVLRGPRQYNVDFSLRRTFAFSEAKQIAFRAEFFNLFNQVNFANPISDLSAVASSGGSVDASTGRIISPGDFGRIISTSNNPRIIQFAVKLTF